MKQILFCSLFLLFACYGRAQSDNRITIGVIDSVYSNILGEHTFKLKNMAGYSVLFEMENGKLVAAYSVQPDGTFKATIKK